MNIVLDLETLGTDTHPVILQIGAVAFDPEKKTIIRKFKLSIDIESCLKAGLKIDAITLAWWMKQPEDVRNKVFAGTTKLETALEEFKTWLNALTNNNLQTVQLWGNGILADNAWLKSAYRHCNMTYPIHYKNDRDIRTLLSMTAKIRDIEPVEITNRIETNDLPHDALADALWEAKLIMTCFDLIVQ